jgi:hypothetical protein
MKLKFSFLLALISLFTFGQSIQLSNEAEISALSIGPGAYLVDSFGHSAFRVRDKQNRIDTVFNYGSYDFNTSNFYLKFAQGKLKYKLATNSYSGFIEFYMAQNRTVVEQILNLSQGQKQQLFEYLLNNAKPENKYYLYDFFFDNCATKLKEVLQETNYNGVVFSNPEGFQPKTFRKLIHEHLNLNSWGSLGIDVALGAVIDRQATAEEHMFLPKFIYRFFEKAAFKDSGKSLVKTTRVLYEEVEKPKSNGFLFSPLTVFGIIGFLILFITYRDSKNNVRTKWIDTTLFILTGLIGVFLLLLWFATDHTATANNYNLLWAFPLNLFVIRQLSKKNQWFIKYLKFLVIMLCLMTLHWTIGVQVFAIGLIPLLLALIVRYTYLIRFFQKG